MCLSNLLASDLKVKLVAFRLCKIFIGPCRRPNFMGLTFRAAAKEHKLFLQELGEEKFWK